MDDLISRQAATELVDWYQHEFSECDYAFGELANELHKLPSAEPEIRCVAQINFSKDDLAELVNEKVTEIKAAEPRWIPVTERLPEKGVPVLISHVGFVTEDFLDIDAGAMCFWNSGIDLDEELNNLAWMPLPEPWKDGDSSCTT